MEADFYLIEAVIMLLAVAVGISAVCHRFKINPVLGFLVAGALIGPFGFNILSDKADTATLSEMGVVFLMFTIGLEVPIEKLRQMGRLVLGLGSLQVFICGLIIGGAAFMLGTTVEAAIVIGGALTLSSTAMVMQLLASRNEQNTPHGRVSFSILLLQDLAVVPILTLVPLLGATDSNLALSLSIAMLKAGVALVVILVVGRWVLKPIYQYIALMKSHEIFVATTLLIVLGIGWATHAAGLSMTLGAFLAGLLIAETEYRHSIEADIGPFKGLLLAVFFMTVGTLVDPAMALERAPETVAVVLLLMVGKLFIIAGLARCFNVPWGTSLRSGGFLGQSGEFAFVILGLAIAEQVVPDAIASWLIMCVVFTMALTPIIIWIGQKLGQLVEGEKDASDPIASEETDHIHDHVIIAGFGRVGQAVGKVLDVHGIPYLALDMGAKRVSACRNKGLPVYYGDASMQEVWRAAGAERAKAAIITMDADHLACAAVEALNNLHPDIHIIARTQNIGSMDSLADLGADTVIPEIVEASLQIASLTLRACGVSSEEASATVDTFRDDDYQKLSDRIHSATDSAGDSDSEAPAKA